MVAANKKSVGSTATPATWNPREREAWRVPPPLKPSQWAEMHRVIYKSSIPGPYRLDNAPYQRGMMDIPTKPGCVQVVFQKGARIGWSEILLNLIGYWAHHAPRPVGLTLPNRDEGRKVSKSKVRPVFRRTPVLRALVGNLARDLLIESVDLVNGFHLGLMWSGSAASTAGKLFQVVMVDEADKTEDWAGDEPDLIGRLESRTATYGDRRMMLVGSTPTTVAGNVHQLLLETSFVLYYHVPCPHCGERQRLVWPQFKWTKPADIDRWLAAARKAKDRKGTKKGRVGYDEDGYKRKLADRRQLGLWIGWLTEVRKRMDAADTKGRMADVLSYGREHLVWYECISCKGRIFDHEKAAMIRKGRWTTEAGYVVDYWGKRHEDAETVQRWPTDTRVGFQIATWYTVFMHWATITGEFLRAEKSLKRSFNWRTERAGQPFEHQIRRLGSDVFSGKVDRATLDAGIAPRWAWLLLATIDTQMDHFYVVVRAWGAGEKSQRVWHGTLMTFDEIDHLLMETTFPVENDEFPPMQIAHALIDSGGTADRWMDATRTQQVYSYVLPRQGLIRAIKGASKPGANLYWPMRSPMAGIELRAWMVDKHRCNDLLADKIIQGVPRKGEEVTEPETWLLNRCTDEARRPSFAEYNEHMAAVHKAPDKPGRNMVEVWKPIHSGARIDYRDCEAYQMALAQMAQVHLLPAEAEVMTWKQVELEQIKKEETSRRERGGGGGWGARPL